MPTVASPQPTKSRFKSSGERRAVPAPVQREVTDAEIAVRAFELYCARGCEDGRDLEDWLQAERELRENEPGRILES